MCWFGVIPALSGMTPNQIPDLLAKALVWSFISTFSPWVAEVAAEEVAVCHVSLDRRFY